ncbi:MAG: hypothetical protein ABH833_00250 [Parcubacteria group bacterium]
MSNYIVHFTKGGEDTDDYRTMMSIYSSCALVPQRRFGIGKDKAPAETEQRAVCFSEIPPGHWHRIVERRQTKYGLAFTKEFILSKGGGPIWYAWKDTLHWQTLQDMMRSAADDPTAHIWNLTPLIDAPGEYGRTEYRFDWEREWRHVGRLSFRSEEVAFLLIPEALHGAAHAFFEDARDDNLGPSYFCPYVDPLWSREHILTELNK